MLKCLEKKNKKRVLKLDEFESFLATMMISARKMLEKLTIDVLTCNRFIIMPLNSKCHWYLLVFDTVEKQFIQMNSLWCPQSKGTTKVFVSLFNSFFLHCVSHNIIGKKLT